MRTGLLFICLILCSATQLIFAQAYFVLVIKNDDQRFNFSESAKLNLIDENGNNRLIKKDEAVTVRGQYRLEVKESFIEDVEIIEANGGQLEIFILPISIRSDASYNSVSDTLIAQWDEQITSYKPELENREITNSETIENSYNVLLVFKNDVVFSYTDGFARAWEDGEELKVKKSFELETSAGILKISFNLNTTETRWFWQ